MIPTIRHIIRPSKYLLTRADLMPYGLRNIYTLTAENYTKPGIQDMSLLMYF